MSLIAILVAKTLPIICSFRELSGIGVSKTYPLGKLIIWGFNWL